MIVDVPGIPVTRVIAGVRVVKYALVDAEDFVSLNEWAWNLCGAAGVYAGRRQSLYEAGDRTPLALFMHRILLDLEPGDPRVGDHINGNKLDNRRANLRAVTRAENTQNVPARSGLRGVHLYRGKWAASGSVGGRRKTIGYFDTEAEAGAAAAAWRAEHMPFSREAFAQ